MKVISGGRVFKRSVLLYRGLRHRKGHGVHSPFAFNLITKVIDERASFYCQNEIDLTRKKVCAIDRTFRLSDKNGREDVRNFSADEIVRKMVVKPKHGALLTRLTNYFKPQTILQIGCAGGFSTLYLSAYASNIKAIVLEENAGWMSFDRLVFEKHGAKNIVLQEGAYRSILPEVVSEVGKVDFVYFDSFNDPDLNTFAFQQCLPCLHEKSVLMIAGIKKSGEMKALWKRLCAMSEVGVTMDVYEYGIVFFDKKLYKRNYIVSF